MTPSAPAARSERIGERLPAPPPIVVGCDAGAGTRDAIALAGRLAVGLGAELILASAAPQLPPPPSGGARDDQLGAATAEAMRSARHALATLAEVPPHRYRALAEPAAAALTDVAHSEDAELIVVGPTHRGPLGKITLGSTGQRLVREGSVPVAIAPRGYAEREAGPLREIGIAFDDSPEARRALQLAVRLAGRVGGKLHGLVVEQPRIAVGEVFRQPSEPELASDAAADRARFEAALEQALEGSADHPASIAVDVLLGDAAGALLGVEERALDLLAIGSHGQAPLTGWLVGSVSAAISDLAPWPVLVVPARAPVWIGGGSSGEGR